MPVMQVVQRLMGEAMQATLQWQCARILCGVMEGVGAGATSPGHARRSSVAAMLEQAADAGVL